jgi:phenylalanyl-tRNA synthetase beta chain
MNISLNWLATHLDLSGKSIKEIDDLFTFAGVEVEGIISKGITSDRIVVAQIMEVIQHPNADRLKVTQVDCGEATYRQIVCGAQNYKVGDKVPCALPGAELPGGFTIGETVMRKVESRGMLCAAAEIGLPAGEDGLLILPAAAEIGKPVKALFDSDTLLELEVTPNRPDLLSHRGMARELATLLKTPLIPLEITLRETAEAEIIRIDAPQACPLYTAVRISGVTVVESPAWLKQRLESIGLRPINNIVDVTNYVLHEFGQPLHAFDAAKLSGKIIIRNAAAGETFLALDESSHILTADDLLISDESAAVLALAGIMGGAASGVTAATTDILLESAYFTPQGIRRSSRCVALSSDSSYRFERGVDPAGVLTASAFAVKLILEIAGGSVAGPTEIAGEAPVLTQPVALDFTKLDQLMGSSISHAAAAEILSRLGLTPLADGRWDVPSCRADLQRHIDLVEEIARVHGLANVPSRFQGTFVPASAVDAAYDADMVLRRRLAALGLHECQTIKLIADGQMGEVLPLRPLQDGDVIRVKLPLSEDHAIMRPSIVPGLIASAARNVRQQAKSLRFFEMGRVFRNAGGGKAKDQESETLALLLAGTASPSGWSQTDRAADLYDLKAILSALLGDRKITFLPTKDRPGFVLASDIKLEDQTIGIFARVSPGRERELDFTTPVFVAELDLGKLRKLLNTASHVTELPQFPGSSRDAAMELPLTTPNAQVEAVIAKLAEPLLISAECFDVFTDATGEKIPADRKSIAYRFLYREATRTLKTEEIDTAHQKVLTALTESLGVKFR